MKNYVFYLSALALIILPACGGVRWRRVDERQQLSDNLFLGLYDL